MTTENKKNEEWINVDSPTENTENPENTSFFQKNKSFLIIGGVALLCIIVAYWLFSDGSSNKKEPSNKTAEASWFEKKRNEYTTWYKTASQEQKILAGIAVVATTAAVGVVIWKRKAIGDFIKKVWDKRPGNKENLKKKTPETPVKTTETPETPVKKTETPETPVKKTETPETPVKTTETPLETP